MMPERETRLAAKVLQPQSFANNRREQKSARADCRSGNRYCNSGSRMKGRLWPGPATGLPWESNPVLALLAAASAVRGVPGVSGAGLEVGSIELMGDVGGASGAAVP